MSKLSGKDMAAWEKTRDLNAELSQALETSKGARWVRKTELIPLADGSLRRVVTSANGAIEKDELIPADTARILAARAATGLSQMAFSKLLGVSLRTLQEWEQGRKSPSGAAATLLKVAALHPEVLRDIAG